MKRKAPELSLWDGSNDPPTSSYGNDIIANAACFAISASDGQTGSDLPLTARKRF